VVNYYFFTELLPVVVKIVMPIIVHNFTMDYHSRKLRGRGQVPPVGLFIIPREFSGNGMLVTSSYYSSIHC